MKDRLSRTVGSDDYDDQYDEEPYIDSDDQGFDDDQG